MSSHELAKQLLSMPDKQTTIRVMDDGGWWSFYRPSKVLNEKNEIIISE